MFARTLCRYTILKNANFSDRIGARLNRSVNTSSQSQVLPLIQKARTLVEARKVGVLTSGIYCVNHELRINNLITVSIEREKAGNEAPLWGSVMPYVIGSKGKPLIALRPTEEHSQFIKESSKVSLVVSSEIAF